MIVLDASAVIEFLLGTSAGLRVAERIESAGQALHAPHLIDVEVAQVLRRLVATDQLAADRAEQALGDLADLPLVRYPHDLLLPRVWALRQNLTAYDAVYVALAEALEAPLLTLDARLAAAPGHGATIELVAS